MPLARPLPPADLPLVAATVIATAGPKLIVREDSGESLTASLGVVHDARAGDRVLVAFDGRSACVVAVLGVVRAPSATADGARLADGASAAKEGERLTIRDADGRLLVEHRAGRTIVHSEADLSMSAPGGSVRIEARDEVLLEAESVKMKSGASTLELDDDGCQLHTPELTTTAEEASIRFRSASLTVRTATFCADRVRAAYDVVETDARRIVERATQAYREVEDVAQLKAGRIRQVAEGTLSLLSKRALIRAETEVAVKGDKINLG